MPADERNALGNPQPQRFAAEFHCRVKAASAHILGIASALAGELLQRQES
jgi:hypothetical protein